MYHTLLYYYIIIVVSICPSQWQLHGSMVVMRNGFYLVFLYVRSAAQLLG